jgi:uncharacterized membrane protein YdbT with pleckstrin-like domain
VPLQLLAGESLIATERQTGASLAPAVIGAALAAGLPIFLLHLVPARVLNHPTGEPVGIATAAVAGLVALWLLVRILGWRLQTYTLTTHRIVLCRGVLSRTTESIGLDRVQDVVVRRPLSARLIRAGSIEIDSAGRDGSEVLRLIPRPQRFYTEILQAVDDHARMRMAYYPPPPAGVPELSGGPAWPPPPGAPGASYGGV